jgi:hypothetical protein
MDSALCLYAECAMNYQYNNGGNEDKSLLVSGGRWAINDKNQDYKVELIYGCIVDAIICFINL